MDAATLRKLMQDVKNGKISPDEAVSRLRHLPFEDLGFANIDHHRRLRVGMPEVIFSRGKTPQQVAGIFKGLAAKGSNVLATKADAAHFRAVKKAVRKAEYHDLAQAIVLKQDTTKYGKGTIAVVCAGTSDIPVAEEAQITAEVMGNQVETFSPWVNPAAAPISSLLEYLASVMNPTAAKGLRAATEVEKLVIRWLDELIGFPTEAGGSGGIFVNDEHRRMPDFGVHRVAEDEQL